MADEDYPFSYTGRKSGYSLYVDGSAPGNASGKGPIGGGALLTWGNRRKGTNCWYFGIGTNNEAEYLALCYGLRWALKRGVTRLWVFSDSQLVVKQVLGEYAVREPHLKPKCDLARSLLAEFKSWRLIWIRREKNVIADHLAAKGVEKGNH